MPNCSVEVYAARAKQAAAAFDYDDECDEDSVLSALVRRDDHEGVLRHLVIGVEDAGAGDAHNSQFFQYVADADRRMAEFAREGWSSFRWDLGSHEVRVARERHPK